MKAFSLDLLDFDRITSLFAAKQIRFIQGASTIITNYLSFSMFSIDFFVVIQTPASKLDIEAGADVTLEQFSFERF
jgi:hypothetical protein